MLKLLQGFAIGFVIAAPVGPVGLLCIRRSIARGWVAGFLTGLGAALADGFFGIVAAFGLTTIIGFITRHTTAFQVTGGTFLVLMGLGTIWARPAPNGESSKTAGLADAGLSTVFFATFVIALVNPATITACLGIFTSFAPDLRTSGLSQTMMLVLGMFLGSGAWWLILSTAASRFARRATAGGLRIVDLTAGIFIVGFGAWQLLRVAFAS